MTVSTSAEAARQVRINVRAGSPLAEVFLIDHSFALVHRSIGDLDATVPPGVYKVKAKLADAEAERLVLCDLDQEVDLSADLRVGSPAPLAKTRQSRTRGSRVAHKLAADTGPRSGSGGAGAMLMTARAGGVTSAPEAALYDAAGTPAGLRSITRSLGWDVTAREPGAYFLRWRGAAGLDVEQTVHMVAGWQTQIFLLEEGAGKIPALSATRISILMSRGGFEPESEDLHRTEEARTALANERKVATETLEDIVEQSDNPMLALFGAHLMLLTRDAGHRTSRARPQAASRFDESRFERIVDRLRELLGHNHPDVVALSTQLPGTSPGQLGSVAAPPMLWRSWLLLLAASNDAPSLVDREVWQRAAAPVPLHPFFIWATDVPDVVQQTEDAVARSLAESRDDYVRRTLTSHLAVPRAVVDEVAARS